MPFFLVFTKLNDLQISLLQESIRALNDHVAQIGDLHSRSLSNTDEASHKAALELDNLVENTRTLSTSLKGRIQSLERQVGVGRDGQIRKQQVRFFFNCLASTSSLIVLSRLHWSSPSLSKQSRTTRQLSSNIGQNISKGWRGSLGSVCDILPLCLLALS